MLALGRGARDRAIARHAEVLGAARVAVTDAAARKDSELASLHEENRVLVGRLVETQTRLMEAESVARTVEREHRHMVEAQASAAAADDRARQAEARIRVARRQTEGTLRMVRAVENWAHRHMRARLVRWWDAVHEWRTVREAEREAEAARRAREAELAGMAQEARDQIEANRRVVAAEVDRRTEAAEKRASQAEAMATRLRTAAKALEEARDEARAEVGHERHKMAALRDRCFRLEADNELLTRAAHTTLLRHALSLCSYITAYHRSMRLGIDDKKNAAETFHGRLMRERQQWRARLEASAATTEALKARVAALPPALDDIPDRRRARELADADKAHAERVTRLRQELEVAVEDHRKKSLEEGVRIGALRAYEHKLREHASMSSVMESGAIDERHGRVALRLEADVQVAAEKVQRARDTTVEAAKRVESARAALREGIESALAAKDEAITELVRHWRLALQAASDLAADVASVRAIGPDGGPGSESAGPALEDIQLPASVAAAAAAAAAPGGPRSRGDDAPVTLVATGARSALWTPSITERLHVPPSALITLPPAGQSAAALAAAAATQSLLSSVTHVFDAASRVPLGSAGPQPAATYGGVATSTTSSLGAATKWGQTQWNPEATGAFSEMKQREAARRGRNERALGDAEATRKTRDELVERHGKHVPIERLLRVPSTAATASAPAL